MTRAPGTQSLRLAALAAVSLAGIALGHAVVYAAVPATHTAARALADAGHGPWVVPWQAVPVALLVGLAASALAARRTSSPSRVGDLALELAGLQTLGFLLLETAERVAHGTAGVVGVVAEPVVVVGLAVQVVVALFLAAMLRAGDVAVRARRRRGRPSARPRAHPSPPSAHPRPAVARPRPGRGDVAFRAPPLTG